MHTTFFIRHVTQFLVYVSISRVIQSVECLAMHCIARVSIVYIGTDFLLATYLDLISDPFNSYPVDTFCRSPGGFGEDRESDRHLHVVPKVKDEWSCTSSLH
jgi:hypothetical protein